MTQFDANRPFLVSGFKWGARRSLLPAEVAIAQIWAPGLWAPQIAQTFGRIS